MKEEDIRYITDADIPNIVSPCYITSSGELYQWSVRQNEIKKKKIFYDKTHDKAKTNIMVYGDDGKLKSKPVSVASIVYRYFNGVDLDMKKQLDIGHHDNDVMNCSLENIYLRDIRYHKNPRSLASYHKATEFDSTPHNGIFGLQYGDMTLVLSDFDSVMTFLEMKGHHRDAAVTKLTIDTTNWTTEQLRKLLKNKSKLSDTIIK